MLRFIMTRSRVLGVVILQLCCLAWLSSAPAQHLPIVNDGAATQVSDSQIPRFDVASVKEDRSESGLVEMSFTADGFSGTNLKLRDLVCMAYGLRPEQILKAPGWMSSTGFNIRAKVSGPELPIIQKLTIVQRRTMLQPLLEDRFGLRFHKDSRTLPVYDLLVSPGGVRFKPVSNPGSSESATQKTASGNAPSVRVSAKSFTGTNVSIANLTDELSYVLERTVVDKTNLLGKYDIALQWSLQEDDGKEEGKKEDEGPIFTAIKEQLGLKLQRNRAPVEVFVIDTVSPPTAN